MLADIMIDNASEAECEDPMDDGVVNNGQKLMTVVRKK
jgi:hypothetical protein